MKRKTLVIGLAIFLLATSCFTIFYHIENIKADTIPTLYVGEGETYTTIQSAIDAAYSLSGGQGGYRIVVYNGTYTERLNISCKLDIFGEDKTNTIINGNGSGTVVWINASYVNISHFTIKNSGNSSNDSIININSGHSIITDNNITSGHHGIILNNSDSNLIYDNIILNNNGDGIRLNQSDNNINISYNTISGNKNGIYLYSSDSNKIYNNNIKNNDENGIFINRTCDLTIIKDNNISNNGYSGIYLNDYSNYSTISENSIYNNNNSGIILENCSWSTIYSSNIVNRNSNYGLMIVGSNNVVQSNIFYLNNKDGIFLNADDNTTISDNDIGYNTLVGIRSYNSTSDNISNNEIFNNSQYGMYLDFFTMNNLIYNNYFHDNTKNAADKSQNHNMWNVTKTSGTNKVGGSYICGNYWDDYDEISEGAYDSNGDGIADDSYTIYASNKDEGALLDVTPPSIGTPSISPSSQTIGGYTNISVSVTDNLEVRAVYLHLLDPNKQTINFSITQNRTSTTYYCYKQFSPIGTYTFHIAAKDSRNWTCSDSKTFTITEGVAPTITDNSPTTASPGEKFEFNATVKDDTDNASDLAVYVIWSHGKEGGNQSMTIASGNYFIKDVVLDRSIENLTYHIYASDQWGNSVTTSIKTVTVVDSEAPKIIMNKFGPSFDVLPNSFTFNATVTDNVDVSDVYIEYWYPNSENITADMDYKGNNYYEKVIIPENSPDRVYCVIYANDTSGNTNDTMNATADCNGPYTGFVAMPITFNGTNSHDLDGSIVDYSWNFGDQTTSNGTSPSTEHTYYSSGNYTVKLTVTDDDGNTGCDSTYVLVYQLIKIEPSDDTKNEIEQTYNLTLDELFYCYDSDGDGVADTFADPNNVLTAVHTGHVNVSGDILFLLSIDDSSIPEFFWNTTNDTITPIRYRQGVINETIINEDEEKATVHATVNKSDDWLFIEVSDIYPDASLTVKTGDRTISEDRIWRKNSKIYIFDDPETEYQFIFEGIYPKLTSPTFSPADSGMINEDSTTITITYNVPVKITYAAFGDLIVNQDLVTTDNIVFTYTPPGYLEDGWYIFDVDAQALRGNGYDSSEVNYYYTAYALPPEKSFIETNLTWILTGAGIAILVAIVIMIRTKKITLDDFIYIKNKKILPFFRPLIIGPVSVHVDDDRIHKAEFYVDGKLKETLTKPPFLWKWNETTFLKHTMETKVYDSEGNHSSSGEMEFYIFNSSKLFK